MSVFAASSQVVAQTSSHGSAAFVAEVCDGLRAGPPYYGLLPFAQTPSDGGSDRPERLLAEPFPLTATWMWENDEEDEEALSEQEFEARMDAAFDHGSLLLAPTAAACTGTWSSPARSAVTSG